MAANLLLASIGLTLAVDSLGLATHASALAAILLEKQIVAILNSIETTGKSQMEELPVQFAHLLGAYLLPRLVVTSDESLVCRLMSACYARLRSIAGRNRQPSVAYTITEISINDFSLGLALGGSLGWLAESAYAELASSSSDAKQPTALGDCIRLFVSSCACIAEEGLACGDDDKCRLPPGVVYGFLLALGNALQQEPLRSSCPLRNPSVLQALVTVRSAAFRFVQNRTISDSNEWKLYYLSGAFRLLAATIDHSLLSPMENSQIIGHQLEAFVSRKVLLLLGREN
jgi:hypothetical protein